MVTHQEPQQSHGITMKLFIAGANGQIGRHLIKVVSQLPHQSRALVRNPDQIDELRDLGADEVVVGDLEQDCTEHLNGCDAVIFTAGSGPHTGPDKTIDVDRDGAIRLIDAAKAAGVKRFIMVSSMRARFPEKAPEKIHHYLEAKRLADEHLEASGLTYTIVCPGPLTNDAAHGHIQVGNPLEATGSIAREEVALIIAAALEEPNTENKLFDVLSGDTDIQTALASL